LVDKYKVIMLVDDLDLSLRNIINAYKDFNQES